MELLVDIRVVIVYVYLSQRSKLQVVNSENCVEENYIFLTCGFSYSKFGVIYSRVF